MMEPLSALASGITVAEFICKISQYGYKLAHLQQSATKLCQRVCELDTLCGAVNLGLEAAEATLNTQGKHDKELEEALEINKKQLKWISEQLKRIEEFIKGYLSLKDASHGSIKLTDKFRREILAKFRKLMSSPKDVAKYFTEHIKVEALLEEMKNTEQTLTLLFKIIHFKVIQETRNKQERLLVNMNDVLLGQNQQNSTLREIKSKVAETHDMHKRWEERRANDNPPQEHGLQHPEEMHSVKRQPSQSSFKSNASVRSLFKNPKKLLSRKHSQASQASPVMASDQVLQEEEFQQCASEIAKLLESSEDPTDVGESSGTSSKDSARTSESDRETEHAVESVHSERSKHVTSQDVQEEVLMPEEPPEEADGGELPPGNDTERNEAYSMSDSESELSSLSASEDVFIGTDTSSNSLTSRLTLQTGEVEPCETGSMSKSVPSISSDPATSQMVIWREPPIVKPNHASNDGQPVRVFLAPSSTTESSRGTIVLCSHCFLLAPQLDLFVFEEAIACEKELGQGTRGEVIRCNIKHLVKDIIGMLKEPLRFPRPGDGRQELLSGLITYATYVITSRMAINPFSLRL